MDATLRKSLLIADIRALFTIARERGIPLGAYEDLSLEDLSLDELQLVIRAVRVLVRTPGGA